MPRKKNGTDSIPTSGSAAVRLFLKGAPKATTPEIMEGVKSSYGFDVSKNTVYNIKGKFKQGKKPGKRSRKTVSAAASPESNHTTIYRSQLLETAALARKFGGVAAVRIALTMIEELADIGE